MSYEIIFCNPHEGTNIPITFRNANLTTFETLDMQGLKCVANLLFGTKHRYNPDELQFEYYGDHEFTEQNTQVIKIQKGCFIYLRLIEPAPKSRTRTDDGREFV